MILSCEVSRIGKSADAEQIGAPQGLGEREWGCLSNWCGGSIWGDSSTTL